MTTEELARAVTTAAADELGGALTRICHCVGQLNDEQVWRRAHPSLNSIGNLLLHLTGNLRQWIVNGLQGAPDFRNRPAEFAEQGPIPRAELLDQLTRTVAEAQTVLRSLSAEQLTSPRRIQGFDLTGVVAIFDSVPHFRGHTQEIIRITRELLGDRYQYFWQPSTPEEGAPHQPEA
jgi:hypothetical protein